jgi:hypothetical protein
LVRVMSMKKLIYRYEDYNMAGSEWTWEFYLETEKGVTYLLSSRHECAGQISETDIEGGLKSGAEVYWSLRFAIMETSGWELTDAMLPSIAEQIAEVSPTTAAEFLAGPASEDTRGEDERAAAAAYAAYKEEALKPFRKKIDAYVLRFSDKGIRFPGGGTYGNPRAWARRFLEEYALSHGRLPHGKHQIKVTGAVSYSGPTHDFSDIT